MILAAMWSGPIAATRETVNGKTSLSGERWHADSTVQRALRPNGATSSLFRYFATADINTITAPGSLLILACHVDEVCAKHSHRLCANRRQGQGQCQMQDSATASKHTGRRCVHPPRGWDRRAPGSSSGGSSDKHRRVRLPPSGRLDKVQTHGGHEAQASLSVHGRGA